MQFCLVQTPFGQTHVCEDQKTCVLACRANVANHLFDSIAEGFKVAREDLILDPASIDLDRVIADLDEIRQTNPQRYEMEQLTAIVYDDVEQGICAGYLDIKPDAFWVRGHMPGMPLMPGVLMCEMAAQVSTWYVGKHDLMPGKKMGFGGMDEVKFRGIVRPGDRLVTVLKQVRYSPGRMLVCRFQGFVDNSLVVQGQIRGVPLPDRL